jgi:hypothetical protein
MSRIVEHIRYCFALSAALLLAVNAVAREQKAPSGRDVDPKTGMKFPARVGVFERAHGVEYDDAGYPMASYLAGQLGWATVFYYKNAPFPAEYANARDAVKMKTPTAKLISDGSSNLHSSGRRSVFTFDDTSPGGPKIKMMSELLMFPHRDYYLTFRISYPAARAERVHQEIDTFVRGFRMP